MASHFASYEFHPVIRLIERKPKETQSRNVPSLQLREFLIIQSPRMQEAIKQIANCHRIVGGMLGNLFDAFENSWELIKGLIRRQMAAILSDPVRGEMNQLNAFENNVFTDIFRGIIAIHFSRTGDNRTESVSLSL